MRVLYKRPTPKQFVVPGIGLLLTATAFLLPASRASINYDYDHLHRLVRVTYEDGSRITYEYDAAGNRTRRTVTGPLVGDFDHDGDVDAADFDVLAGCLTGPGVPAAPDCTSADLSGDNDVDLADFLRFQTAFTGPE